MPDRVRPELKAHTRVSPLPEELLQGLCKQTAAEHQGDADHNQNITFFEQMPHISHRCDISLTVLAWASSHARWSGAVCGSAGPCKAVSSFKNPRVAMQGREGLWNSVQSSERSRGALRGRGAMRGSGAVRGSEGPWVALRDRAGHWGAVRGHEWLWGAVSGSEEPWVVLRSRAGPWGAVRLCEAPRAAGGRWRCLRRAPRTRRPSRQRVVVPATPRACAQHRHLLRPVRRRRAGDNGVVPAWSDPAATPAAESGVPLPPFPRSPKTLPPGGAGAWWRLFGDPRGNQADTEERRAPRVTSRAGGRRARAVGAGGRRERARLRSGLVRGSRSRLPAAPAAAPAGSAAPAEQRRSERPARGLASVRFLTLRNRKDPAFPGSPSVSVLRGARRELWSSREGLCPAVVPGCRCHQAVCDPGDSPQLAGNADQWVCTGLWFGLCLHSIHSLLCMVLPHAWSHLSLPGATVNLDLLQDKDPFLSVQHRHISFPGPAGELS